MLVAAAQAAAAAAVLRRLARGRDRAAPLEARRGPAVSVVIPARDEAARIAPCLRALHEDPDAAEVIVVDDRSSDRTADMARALGATVIAGREPPDGWVGKPWALQQGVEAASCDVVVCLDADTRPRPGLLGALAGELDHADWVTAGARFVCRTAGERWLHPALFMTLVYRYGPAPAPGGRILANGQCTATRRGAFLAAGAYAPAAAHMTDDAALARALAARGWRVRFADATRLVDVEMHDDVAGVWREWGRSIALADVESRGMLVGDVATVWLTLGLPLLRRRPFDWALLALRLAMTAAVRDAYAQRGAAYWLSPLADPLAAARLTWSAARPPRRWRGRRYGAGGTAHRPAS